jgi:hypothetical protein
LTPGRPNKASASSLHEAFLWAVPLAPLAFCVIWLLNEAPLRETAHVRALATEEVPTDPPEA